MNSTREFGNLESGLTLPRVILGRFFPMLLWISFLMCNTMALTNTVACSLKIWSLNLWTYPPYSASPTIPPLMLSAALAVGTQYIRKPKSCLSKLCTKCWILFCCLVLQELLWPFSDSRFISNTYPAVTLNKDKEFQYQCNWRKKF